MVFRSAVALLAWIVAVRGSLVAARSSAVAARECSLERHPSLRLALTSVVRSASCVRAAHSGAAQLVGPLTGGMLGSVVPLRRDRMWIRSYCVDDAPCAWRTIPLNARYCSYAGP